MTTITSATPRAVEPEYAPPRMTMLRETVHAFDHEPARSLEQGELDPAAALRRAVHEAVAAARAKV